MLFLAYDLLQILNIFVNDIIIIQAVIYETFRLEQIQIRINH